MSNAEQATLNAANQIVDVNEIMDVRAIAASFVAKRLNNSLSIEDIRKDAISRLASKINGETGAGTLLNVIEVLGGQSAVDFTALSRVQAAPSTKNAAVSPIAAIFGVSDTAVGTNSEPAPTLPKEAYGLLDKLVVAADSIINARVPSRLADVVTVTDVKPKPAKKPTTKKKVTVAAAKKTTRAK